MSTNKYGQPSLRRSIIKSTSIISLGTLSSRFLGFIRDVILALMLGTGMRADAFFVALRISSMLRDIVGEGATNSTVVPVFSEYLSRKDDVQTKEFFSVLLTLSFIILLSIAILGVLFAPVLIRVMAPGFIGDFLKLDLAIRLTRMMFPYLIFAGLTAFSFGILYSFHSFLIPAFTPCLWNISIIACAMLVGPLFQEPVFALALGVLLGGVIQLFFQIKPLRDLGLRFKRPVSLVHPGVRQIGRLLVPRIFGSGIYQLNVFVDTFCASLSSIVGMGGISAIYFANRIIQLPLGLFGFSLAAVILPTLSGFSSQDKMEDFKETLVFSLKSIYFIMLPISITIFLLGAPIIRVIFQRGAFADYSTQITSLALLFYSIGLVSYGGNKILVTAFHSLQDTITPVRSAGISLMINVILNFVLMWPLRIGGIALASSIAATFQFLFMFYLLNKKLGGIAKGLLPFAVKVLLATVVMGVVIVFSWDFLEIPQELSRLFLTVVCGSIAFFLAAYILKIEEVKEISRWVLRRK